MSPVRPNVHVIGRRLDPDHHELRDFLTRAAQPHDWHDADSPEARELLARHGLTADDLPVVIDGERVIAGVGLDAGWTSWQPHRH